jgi:diphthamide synthase (EF-2-diphthine--ammonia ligase)
MPEVEAVCSGAVLSDYQRNRIENVYYIIFCSYYCSLIVTNNSCSRLGLVSLAYLWRRDQSELLQAILFVPSPPFATLMSHSSSALHVALRLVGNDRQWYGCHPY